MSIFGSAKQDPVRYSVSSFLPWFVQFTGDLMDEENVLEFLTSLEAMDLPDRIEEVNAKILSKIVEDTDFVAVLFCKSKCHNKSTYVIPESLYPVLLYIYAQTFKHHLNDKLFYLSSKN